MSNTFQQEMAAIQKALEAISSLSEDQRQFAVETIVKRLNIQVTGIKSTDVQAQDSHSNHQTIDKKISPKQFMAQKKPTTEVEQIVCLAYYLTHFRDQPSFKTIELTKLNTEAATPKISNPTRSVDNATKQNFYLAAAGNGKKQITSFGEDIVKALPDREKVKLVISEGKPKKAKRTAQKAKRPD